MIANRLKSGDTIGIISPAYAVREHQYDECLSGLTALGYNIKTGKNLYNATQGYAASEQDRADDFNAMMADESIKMILFGGGYVSNEILPLVDFRNIAEHPKLIASYSDGTTLLDAIYSQTGLITYYGQRPATFANLSEYNRLNFVDSFINGDASAFRKNSEWKTINSGRSEGTLIGGYVENFALLLSGKYFSIDKTEKYLLILEDYKDFSSPARISMYLSHIEQSEIINNVSGLLFGHYDDTENKELTERLQRFGAKHNIPTIYCDDFGHGTNHGIIPIGQKAILNTADSSLQYV